MRKYIFLLLAMILLCSHNLYIKMDTYFLQPDQKAVLSLYNGTFEESENIITRDRMLNASIVAHGERKNITPDRWKDKDTTITQLPFTTGKAGTYVVGVSTKARNIALTAEKFNSYLEHDGVKDMLAKRTKDSLLKNDALESYQKHVKAIYQVGDTKTDDWNTVLGYPIEFVPQTNPYETYSGETLDVQLLLDGKPLANQIVYADHINGSHDHATKSHSHGNEAAHTHDDDTKSHSHGNEAEHTHDDDTESHSHGNEAEHTHDDNTETHSHGNEAAHTHDDGTESHTHESDQEIRTNAQGIATINLPEDGIYYLRTIHMTEINDESELTHQSKWATLTFEVSHKHDSTTHTHDDAHDHEEGIPTWLFIVGSIVIIGILFFIFRKKN